MFFSLLASLLLNLLVMAALLFVTVREPRRPAVPILVSAVSADPEPDFVPPPPKTSANASAVGGPSNMAVAAVTWAPQAPTSISLSISSMPSDGSPGLTGLEGIGSNFGSGFGSGGSGPGGPSMKVGKIMVKAKSLGLILDVSGSMEEELPKVKREVRRAFKEAKIVEVKGCRLDAPERTETAEGERRPPRLRSQADSVIEAVDMLVGDGRADAIYWFSDLQDGETEEGLARLGELLKIDRGKARSVKFYVRSLQREPSPALNAIVRASGGAVQAGEKAE